LFRSRHHDYSHAVIPRRPFHAQNMASSKMSDRPTHHLSLSRTRDVRTVKPIAESNPAASARLGELSHPSRPTNKPKEVARVSVTQCLQHVRNMKPRNNEPQSSSLFLPERTQSPLRAHKQDKRSCASFCHPTPSTDSQHETSR